MLGTPVAAVTLVAPAGMIPQAATLAAMLVARPLAGVLEMTLAAVVVMEVTGTAECEYPSLRLQDLSSGQTD